MAEAFDTLRVVLLGKTGAGKSSTGNTLLGRDCFEVARGLRSGTERCQWADAEIESQGVHLQVTDTPGVSDTHRDEEDVLKEVGKSIAVASPGPHVILMVIRCARFTQEEYMAYRTLKNLFGEAVKDFMILVFVGIDIFDADSLEEQRMNFNEEMNEAAGDLKTVLDEANRRIFGINNKTSKKDRQRQADDLIQMMKAFKRQRGGQYFRNGVSDQVNELVSPLVRGRVAQGNMTETEAIRQTNRAIVEETESPTFFHKLFDFIHNKVLPVMIDTIKVGHDAINLYKHVKESGISCSVM